MAFIEVMRPFIRKAGNQGLVIMTAGNDLLHIMPLPTSVAAGQQTGARSAAIVKICCYNNTGANVTLSFGTLNRAGAPAFVPLLPLLVAINTFDNEWEEDEIPFVEFMNWPIATAAGRTGDIYCLCSAAGPTVSIEVHEFGG
jgi:hypothetical protein